MKSPALTVTLITRASQVPDATAEQLRHAYAHYEHGTFELHTPIAVMRRKVEMSLLAAIDRAAHAGVPRGAEPLPENAPPPDDSYSTRARPVMRVMAQDLLEHPMEPARAKGRARSADLLLRAIPGGLSEIRPGSQRAAVLHYIRAQKADWVALSKVTEVFGMDCRGHVQKLLQKAHLELKK